MSKLSIKDIAKKAGVCIGTVSRVINNLDRVHPETRETILKIIKESGYRPSSAGRALVSGRTNNILIVLHNIADPYCAALSKIFSRHCHERGYKMLLGDSDYRQDMEAEHLIRARDGSADGLIISPIPGRDNAATFREMVAAGFPLVAIDNRLGGVRTNCVKYNDRAAAALAVDYLVRKGHRRIAFMQSHSEFQTVHDRLTGYRQALARFGLSALDGFQAPHPRTRADAAAGILSLVRGTPAPTALLAENEIMSMICLNTLLQAGYNIPRKIAVIAIGDTLDAHFTPVPLTTVSLHHELMCETAIARLNALLDHPTRPEQSPKLSVIEPELMVRGSA